MRVWLTHSPNRPRSKDGRQTGAAPGGRGQEPGRRGLWQAGSTEAGWGGGVAGAVSTVQRGCKMLATKVGRGRRAGSRGQADLAQGSTEGFGGLWAGGGESGPQGAVIACPSGALVAGGGGGPRLVNTHVQTPVGGNHRHVLGGVSPQSEGKPSAGPAPMRRGQNLSLTQLQPNQGHEPFHTERPSSSSCLWTLMASARPPYGGPGATVRFRTWGPQRPLVTSSWQSHFSCRFRASRIRVWAGPGA